MWRRFLSWDAIGKSNSDTSHTTVDFGCDVQEGMCEGRSEQENRYRMAPVQSCLQSQIAEMSLVDDETRFHYRFSPYLEASIPFLYFCPGTCYALEQSFTYGVRQKIVLPLHSKTFLFEYRVRLCETDKELTISHRYENENCYVVRSPSSQYTCLQNLGHATVVGEAATIPFPSQFQ